MSNSLHEVKTRIDSTKSTAQTTKAMYMVSQSKVRRAEKAYKDYQSFMNSVASMVTSVVTKAGIDYSHPLLTKRDVKKTCYLIVTSDRGLAGAYNANTFKALEQTLETHSSKDEFIVTSIGRKGFSYIEQKGYPTIVHEPILVRDDVMFIDIVPLAEKIIDLYLVGTIDRLVIIYNHYVNSLTQEIKETELLPITALNGEVKDIDYIYESGIEKTLDMMLPMYLEDMIYGIILDAKTSEHSSRMNSMRSASDNADEVISKLQLLYNRARQNVITTELIDIIGGANAIGGKE